MDINRLRRIESEWEKIENSFRISPFESPLNRPEEREYTLAAFNKGKSYNPQFHYKDVPEYPIDVIRRFMCDLHISESEIERLYYQKARLQLLTIECILTKSPDIITATTSLVYGLPSRQLVNEATRILSTSPKQDKIQSEVLSAEEAVESLQRELNRVNIEGWTAIINEYMNSLISINRKDREVKIRKGSTFSLHDLRRLLVHEIGVHVFRFENGLRQPLRLFSSAFPKYLSTEEGLAVYCEDKTKLLQQSTLRKYACRVLGAHLALNKTFYEAFYELTEYIDPESAFEIMVRAKRGFRDTAQYGGHMKDIVYLKGFKDIQEHLGSKPSDFQLLFAGKFGLEHLPLVRSLMETGFLYPASNLPLLPP